MIRFIFLCALILAISAIGWSQDIQFNYDNNGNRISQEVFIIKSLLSNEEWTIPSDTIKRKIITSETALDIIIYPNPVKATLKVVIVSDATNFPLKIEVYSMSGMLIYHQGSTDYETSIELGSLQPGIYILSVTLENVKSFWKIIKK